MSTRARPSPRTLPQRLLRTSRSTGSLVFGLLAAIGAVIEPILSVTLGALFAAIAAMLVCALQYGDPRPLPHPVVVGTAAGLLPATIAGGTAVGVGGLGVLWGAVALAVIAVANWWVSPAAPAIATPSGALPHDDRPHHDGPHDHRPHDDGSLENLLRSLPIDVLCDEWSRIATPAEWADGSTSGRMQIRRLLIAELRRRDDAGTSRWLAEDPRARPDRYVSSTRDQSSEP